MENLMEQLSLIQRLGKLFSTKSDVIDTEEIKLEDPLQFEPKYKTVIEFTVDESYTEMLYWLHSNSSGSISIKGRSKSQVCIGFENPDDAIVFRIKFL